MKKIFAPFLPPWAETGLQPAFYDVESGTVLQQTARMYDKVNQLTRLFNEFSEATSEEVNAFEREVNETVAEYIEKFTELKDFVDDYFDNLDVQQEINNKLDDMVEQGTLQEIITTYIQSNVAWTFDSVAELKDATNLTADSFAQTFGYYSANGSGSAYYKIRTKEVSDTPDDMFIIALHDNTIVAELVLVDCLYAEQLGAYGDGTHDDTTALQAGIDYCIANNLVFKSKGDKTYLISTTLTVDNCNIDFNNAVIKSATAIDLLTINTEDYYGYIKNVTLDMDSIATTGIKITEGRKKEISNVVINNVTTKGVVFNSGYEVIMHDCHINGNASSSSSIGIELNSGDSNFTDIIMVDCNTAVKSGTASNILTRVHAWILNTGNLTNSKFIDCAGDCVLTMTDCYSDTYQYTLYQESGKTPQILCKGLMVYYNNGIYNHNTYNYNSYVIYANTIANMRYVTIENSYLKGLSDSDIHTYMCNENTFVGILNNNIYFSVTNNIANAITGIHASLTTVKNVIYKVGDMVQIDAMFSYDASQTSGAINIGNLPAGLKPQTAINTWCDVTEKQWNSDEHNITYLYIEDALSVKLPAILTSGTRYIHINIVYKQKQ